MTVGHGASRDRDDADAPILGHGVSVMSNAVVIGGITVGNNAVIGAGSVVIKDIPPNVFAAGNPCRVIREITEEDSMC